MLIVLPGALPDTRAARELAAHLPTHAPTLARWLAQGRARLERADPAVSGCTAFEQWQLSQRGFRAAPGQALGAGLGPLYAAAEHAGPVWLAELVHLIPGQSDAALTPAHALQISEAQSLALFERAQSLFEDSGFGLLPDSTERWRVTLPPDWTPFCASPALVAGTTVQTWWPQDAAARPWRRLANEVQMAWFDHPVNLARQEQGLVPINGLWLFGGASSSQLQSPAGPAPVVHEALLGPAGASDWGAWLQALGTLERTVFAPLAQAHAAPTLVLTGTQRIATITPRGHWLGRWFARSHTWSKWWSSPD